jgi:O-antigen/teichoic acid export membrane protein
MTTSLKRQFFSDASWYGLSYALNLGLRFICLALLWRVIAFPMQQQYALLMVLAGLVQVVADAGLENGVIRYQASGNNIAAIAVKFFRKISIAIVLPLGIGLSIWWKVKFGNWAGLTVSAMGYGFALFSVSAAFMRASRAVSRFALLNAVRNLLIALFVAVLFFFGRLTLTNYFAAYGCISAGMSFFCFQALPSDDASRPSSVGIAPLLPYLLPMLGINMLLWLEGTVDTTFLNHFRPSDLPSFRLILDYASFFSVAALLINRAWPAVYFRFAKEKSPGVQNAGHQPVVSLLLVIALVVIVALSPWVLLLLTGVKPPMSMYPALALILAANAVAVLIGLLRPMYEYANRMKYLLVAYSIGMVVNIGANVLLVPRFGLTGAAGAGCLAVLVLYWFLIARIPQNCKIKSVVTTVAIHGSAVLLLIAVVKVLQRVL